jgi:hypothetical protein
MPELERELRALGATIDFPPTPDLVPAVGRRIAEPRARTLLPGRPRWALVFALVALAAALGAVLAVPSARTALLEWLGIRGVTVTRVETAPTAPAPAQADLGLGERIPLGEASARAGSPVAPPPRAAGAPDEVYVAPVAGATQVAFVWRSEDGSVELLLTQARASLEQDFARKLAGPETTIEELRVAGAPALWLAGEPHAFGYVYPGGGIVSETLRLAGNTLLWERGGTTFRLEGDVTREEALRIAESVPAERD